MFCLDVNTTAAQWRQSHCGRSNLGGKQNRRIEQAKKNSPKTAKCGSALKLLCGLLWVADSFFPLEEGRRPMGRNGHEHHGRHRGTGAFIREGLRRDNVGKDHSPAGADGNLPGLSVYGEKLKSGRGEWSDA